MNKNFWGIELPQSFFKTHQIAQNMATGLEAYMRVNQNFWIDNTMAGIIESVNQYQSALQRMIPPDYMSSLMASSKAIQSIVADINLPEIQNLLPSIEKLISKINVRWDISTIDWGWMAETLSTCEHYYSQEESEEILTEQIREEVNESIEDIISNDNVEIAIKAKFIEWQNRHPIFAWLFMKTLETLLAIFIGYIVNCFVGTAIKQANIYEEPSAKSNIIVEININENVTITDEVPYYYEVTYIQPETGEEKTGYVYKPNINIQIENSEDEPNDNK